MMDFTTMSYNKLREEAKSKGFEGQNAKRAELIAFLEALEAPTVAEAVDAAAEALEEAEPITVEAIEALIQEASAAKAELTAATAELKAEPKAEKKSDKIKARRAEVAVHVREIFAANSIAMNWGAVVQKYEAKLGVKHDRVIWHDIGHAIEDLCAEGSVKAHTPEKGRVTYQAVAK